VTRYHTTRPRGTRKLAIRGLVALGLAIPPVTLLGLSAAKAGTQPSALVLAVDTTTAGCNTPTVGLPLQSDPATGSVTPDVNVDWGDESSETVTSTGDVQHTYASPGVYTIAITPAAGSGPSLTQFGDPYGWTGANCVTAVSQWGQLGLTSLAGAFDGASILSSVPATIPPGIDDFVNTFRSATIFNQDIGGWDLSRATTTQAMFYDAKAFNNGGNDSINNWNTAVDTDMSYMFGNDDAFNQNLGSWNTTASTPSDFMRAMTQHSLLRTA
jgi:Mycoplasma protein of unknown function, DUF285